MVPEVHKKGAEEPEEQEAVMSTEEEATGQPDTVVTLRSRQIKNMAALESLTATSPSMDLN